MLSALEPQCENSGRMPFRGPDRTALEVWMSNRTNPNSPLRLSLLERTICNRKEQNTHS